MPFMDRNQDLLPVTRVFTERSRRDKLSREITNHNIELNTGKLGWLEIIGCNSAEMNVTVNCKWNITFFFMVHQLSLDFKMVQLSESSNHWRSALVRHPLRSP
jgi:hypothetical protein